MVPPPPHRSLPVSPPGPHMDTATARKIPLWRQMRICSFGVVLVIALTMRGDFHSLLLTMASRANSKDKGGEISWEMKCPELKSYTANEYMTASTTRKESTSSLENQCGQHPWSLKCFHHYNAGDWTILDNPRNWSQLYGYHKWGTGPKNCERIGKTLEWKSLHNSPSVFERIAFLEAVGNNKVVSFIGDSVSRQSFAVLLEAIATPPETCTWANLSPSIKFPTECVLALGENNITFRMHNEDYGDHIANETYFEEADIIVMNFGVWYVEQQGVGLQTNHTPSTYVPHMVQILKAIETVRKPHQLIVFRESAEMRHKSLQNMTQELRPILIEQRIPIIAHQSARLKRNTTTVADLFHDNIHWCEPALQLAWLTVLLHMVKDWNNSQWRKC